MRKQQWNAGDLVEVTMYEKLGWGDKRESYLVLVLGRHYAKQKQSYHFHQKTVYRVLKKKGGANGGLCLMGLSDWTIGEMTCTNRLVQSSCVEE